MIKDCILAIGTPDKTTGYIRKSVGNKIRYAHRLAYEAAFGEIPKGFCVHHLCGNKICIRPSHLQSMTLKEHNRLHTHPASLKAIAARTLCKLGHPLDGKSNRQRYCKTCHTKVNKNYLIKFGVKEQKNKVRNLWRAHRKELGYLYS